MPQIAATTMNKQPTQDDHSEIRALLRLDKQEVSRLLDRRLLGWAALAAVVLLLAALAIFRSGSSAEQTFVVEPTNRVDLTVIITATGSVQPTNQIDVSSELSGTIRTVSVDFNSPVKVGQVLAELDTDKLKATLNSSRAGANATPGCPHAPPSPSRCRIDRLGTEDAPPSPPGS